MTNKAVNARANDDPRSIEFPHENERQTTRISRLAVFPPRSARSKELNVRTVVAFGACCAMLAAVIALSAQQANFKRTILQQADLSAPGREVVTAVVEFDAGASAPR